MFGRDWVATGPPLGMNPGAPAALIVTEGLGDGSGRADAPLTVVLLLTIAGAAMMSLVVVLLLGVESCERGFFVAELK